MNTAHSSPSHLVETREIRGIQITVFTVLGPDGVKILLELRCERRRIIDVGNCAAYQDTEHRTFQVHVADLQLSNEEKQDFQSTFVSTSTELVSELKTKGAYEQILSGVVEKLLPGTP